MASSSWSSSLMVVFFLVSIFFSHAIAATNTTFRPREELKKFKRIRSLLRKLNKPSVKKIKSPDGDIIDCVPSHLQPAFDHPMLKGQKPLEPPERPKGHEQVEEEVAERFQLWALQGESCPEGTVPIRRTRKADLLRASSMARFGKKPAAANVRRDYVSGGHEHAKPVAANVRRDYVGGGHEHAVGYAAGEEFFGAKASLNVWAPKVTTATEFSLSQIWLISGSFGGDLNTIEAGWQVSPELYGDNRPRFFTYWTTDAYQATGCYNLLCSGFVQTNNRVAIGAAISPLSALKGRQFDISILVWKDPKHGNWWLEFGPGLLVGYWPSFLFTRLARHATMVQFGGEVVNSRAAGAHTGTQMGSGHFPREGFGMAAYFRNLQVVDWDNNLVPMRNLRVLADHPNCYDIRGGINKGWGHYFYYGGPGWNGRCS